MFFSSTALRSRTGMTRYASQVISYLPGEALSAVRQLLDGDGAAALGESPVVVLGRPSVAEHASSVVAAAAVLADVPGVRFISALRRGNVHGALDMGLAPGLLPGRVSLDDGRSWFSDAWGTVPAARGLDTEGILRAAADGQIHGLVLLGADPLGDFPDRDLATRALDRATFVVAVDCFVTESVAKANVVLPAAGFTERPGTTTNLEGRVTRLGAKVTAPDVAWPDWMIAVELAARLGHDLGFATLDDVWSEIERTAPAYAGITRRVLGSKRNRDGVVVPLGSEPERELTSLIDASADPMSTPGVLHAETQGETALEGHPEQVRAGVGSDAASTEEPTERPDLPLITWDRTVTNTREVTPDAYALRLVGVRKLYDDGIVVSMSPSLAKLAAEPILRVNPHDLDRLGVKSGGMVRLRSNTLSTTVVVEADEHQPRGSASLPVNVPGIDTGSLIDIDAPANQIGIETV